MARPDSWADWATDTLDNGRDSTANKTAPKAAKVASGWDFPEKPARNVFNWWMNNVGQWIRYLVSPQYVSISNGQSALAGDKLIPDNSTGAIQVNLPAAPEEGDTIYFRQRRDTLWSVNALKVNPVNSTIYGDASVMTANIDRVEFEMYYTGTEWEVHVTKNL